MEVKHFGIGIHGKKFSGKSEVSSLIHSLLFKWTHALPAQEKIHYFGTFQLAFADKVKTISEDLMPNEELERLVRFVSSEKKEIILEKLSRSPREIWKIVGEMGRQIHPDLWVWSLEEKVDSCLREPERVANKWGLLPSKSFFDSQINNIEQANFVFLIDDVRRANEYQALKNRDFLMFRVLGKNDSNDQHPTETDLDQLTDDHFQAVIHNEERNLEYLISQVQEIFHQLIEPKLNQMIGN